MEIQYMAERVHILLKVIFPGTFQKRFYQKSFRSSDLCCLCMKTDGDCSLRLFAQTTHSEANLFGFETVLADNESTTYRQGRFTQSHNTLSLSTLTTFLPWHLRITQFLEATRPQDESTLLHWHFEKTIFQVETRPQQRERTRHDPLCRKSRHCHRIIRRHRRAAALRFAQEGASVVLHGQNKDNLEAVHCEICKSGVPESRVLVISGPIQDEKTQDKLIQETVKKFGRLDVLVNNAGIVMKTGSDGNSMESYDFVMDVNVRAVYRLIQLATPHLEKAKGAVVNISSGLSEKTYPASIPYSISKAAINHLTRNFANSLASRGIRVNCVAPGIVSTAFVTRHGSSQEQADSIYNATAQAAVPLKRPGRPDEQADLILYLAAPTTSYMTGSVVFNDGGLLCFAS